jgi:hypothetical protein
MSSNLSQILCTGIEISASQETWDPLFFGYFNGKGPDFKEIGVWPAYVLL